MITLLANTTQPDDERLPNTSVNLDLERLLGSVFIASPTYGTRASTLLFTYADGTRRIIERSFRREGMPSGEARFEACPDRPESARLSL